MPLQIIRQDITKIECDAVVNPTNQDLEPTGGVDLAIHKAAGHGLLAECKAIGRISTGEAVITPAYGLCAKYVIHTAGPVWYGGRANEEALLSLCYRNALNLAKENECASIAFPLISSGTYGYPKDKVLKTAISAISDFMFDNEMMVYLVVFDKYAFALSGKLFGEIQSFIDDNYAADHSHIHERFRQADDIDEGRRVVTSIPEQMPCAQASYKHVYEETAPDIDDYIKLDEGFAVKLLKLIDLKGMSDVQCYKKANVSKQTWYKINNEKHYKPNKKTVISFAVALELSLEETQNLLESVGFVLSNSSLFDVIIMYCLKNGIYDVFEIDSILFKYDQETLYSKL